ncbi:MAG: lectin like domain-containing protein [Lachnospiraceae bacterium]|nr:lectin like domain-containing protein [Lachnospiraceae bacterium]
MKFRTRFLVLFLVIVLAVGLKGFSSDERIGTVTAFRGAQLESGVFNPLIAGNGRQAGLLSVKIDGTTYSNQGGETFLNTDQKVMASLHFIRDVFSASAYADADGNLTLQRNNQIFYFKSGKKTGRQINKTSAKAGTEKTSTATASSDKSSKSDDGGEKITLDLAPQEYNGKYYFGMEDLCRLFGYGYSYDANTVTASLDSSTAVAASLPESYDLRDSGRVSKIMDQGKLSACWSYAALSALESSLLPEQSLTFDPKDLANRNSYGIKDKDEGSYMVAVSTLLSWQGPVKEGGTDIAGHLQEVHFYDQDDMDDLKWAIFKNGGVSTSLYVEVNSSDLSKSDYYNSRTDSYYYSGSKKPNHDVVIIGWDDNYDKNNFQSKVPGNGAYICQNSWGSSFGDDGVFYVSYYDTNIGNFAVSYAKFEKTDNYDHIYQSDLCGEVGKIGYNQNTNMAANVYTAAENEDLQAVGFYTTGKDTQYEVYVVDHFTDTGSLASRKELASGTLHDTGFYTIPLQEKVPVNKGQQFAVLVALKTPGTNHPIAIEYKGNAMTENVDLSDGQGFISGNGIDWENVETAYQANLCLKAYSNKRQSRDD